MPTTPWTLAAISLISLTSSVEYVPCSRGRSSLAVATGGPPDTLVVQPSESRIHWQGASFRGPGRRQGDVKVVSGMIIIRHQKLTAGTVAVDMRNVDARFPAAVFSATEAKRTGDSTWQVSGNLTMLGLTRPLTFSTDVRWIEVGHMIATANVVLDRAGWGVAYRDARLTNDPADGDLAVSIALDARRKGSVVAGR